VNLPLVVVLGGLTALTIWGFVAPRSQWRVLTGWSSRDPGGSEPSPVIIGIHRTVAGIAVATLAVGGMSVVRGVIQPTGQSSERAITDPVRLLWGVPDPHVVNRVFVPVTTPPTGLVREPVLLYQTVNGKHRDPAYLFGLPIYTRPAPKATDGYLGAKPPVGLSALDSADLVVQVRADRRCTPQQVLVVESDTAVAVAVYYGRPVGESLDAKTLATPCDLAAKGDKATSVLIPIDLAAPVGTRTVLNLEGTPISIASLK
jgi:hypothetical protein